MFSCCARALWYVRGTKKDMGLVKKDFEYHLNNSLWRILYRHYVNDITKEKWRNNSIRFYSKDKTKNHLSSCAGLCNATNIFRQFSQNNFASILISCNVTRQVWKNYDYQAHCFWRDIRLSVSWGLNWEPSKTSRTAGHYCIEGF